MSKTSKSIGKSILDSCLPRAGVEVCREMGNATSKYEVSFQRMEMS